LLSLGYRDAATRVLLETLPGRPDVRRRCDLRFRLPNGIFRSRHYSPSKAVLISNSGNRPTATGASLSSIDRIARRNFKAGAWAAGSLWWLLLFGATLLGIYAWRYALPKPFSLFRLMSNNRLHPSGMAIHAVAGSIAMMIGPWQLSGSLRRARPRLHRWLGRIYAADAFVAFLASLILTPSAAGGVVSSIAFFLAGALWTATTGFGIAAIWRRDTSAHRRWMIRSVALAFAPLTMHLYAFLGVILGAILHIYFGLQKIAFDSSYPAELWLTLATNVVIAECAWRALNNGGDPSAANHLFDKASPAEHVSGFRQADAPRSSIEPSQDS
jgi:Predicted membrane protein (DUF2306)